MQDNNKLRQEMALRAEIPVFINSFEQLTYLRDTVAWFSANGFRNVTVIEQGSAYPALRHYLQSAEFLAAARLCELGKNVGPRRAVRKVAAMVGLGNPFIFTDPDLDLPETIAPNFLTRLFTLGRQFGVAKVGLALDISENGRNDLQARVGRDHTVLSYYRRFYRNKLKRFVWGVGVDTTFFLHVPQGHLRDFGILQSQPRIPALRVGGAGFIAGHRPWYFDNGMSSEEVSHYRARTSRASTTFGRTA